MGLDMYLSARNYMSEYDEKITPVSEKIKKALGLKVGLKVEYVSLRAAYWRKANAIHAWFVANVQDATDDCGTYEVSREQLQELAAECQKVLDNPKLAAEALPTQGGFFFGSTDYDENYVDDLKSTVEQLTTALNGVPENWWFQYHSSW